MYGFNAGKLYRILYCHCVDVLVRVCVFAWVCATMCLINAGWKNWKAAHDGSNVYDMAHQWASDDRLKSNRHIFLFFLVGGWYLWTEQKKKSFKGRSPPAALTSHLSLSELDENYNFHHINGEEIDFGVSLGMVY